MQTITSTYQIEQNYAISRITGPNFSRLIEIFNRILSYNHRKYDHKQNRYEYERVYLYKVKDGYIYFSTRFIPRIISTFSKLGIKYDIKIINDFYFEPVDINTLDVEFRYKQKRILEKMAKWRFGIIRCVPGYGKTWLITMFCKLHKKSNIIVTSARLAACNMIYDRLSKELHEPIGFVSGSRNIQERVTVSTVQSLKKCSLELCHILLFDECHEAATPTFLSVAPKLRKARMFGFSATPYGRHDANQLVLEELFGPIIDSLDYEEAKEYGLVSDVHACIFDVEFTMGISYINQINIRRYLIWQNATRNKLIKDIADIFIQKGKQVLILCDTVEHVVYLGSLLKDAILVYDNMTPEDQAFYLERNLITSDRLCTSRILPEYYQKFRNKEYKLAISTGIWNTAVDFPDLDVVIRASGDSSLIKSLQTPGRAMRKTENKTTAFVVDFVDYAKIPVQYLNRGISSFQKNDCVYMRNLYNRSLTRIREYKKLGFNIKRFSSVSQFKAWLQKI